MTGRKPTERELDILHVLWANGPSTVRDVHETIHQRHATGYTTTLKLMQIMAEKGLVLRDESHRSHVYRAAITEEEAQSSVVRDLLDRVFAGSAEKLVLCALSGKHASAAELAEVRRLLDEMEEGRRDDD